MPISVIRLVGRGGLFVSGSVRGGRGKKDNLNIFTFQFRLMKRRIWLKGHNPGLSLSTWRFTPAPKRKTGLILLCFILSSCWLPPPAMCALTRRVARLGLLLRGQSSHAARVTGRFLVNNLIVDGRACLPAMMKDYQMIVLVYVEPSMIIVRMIWISDDHFSQAGVKQMHGGGCP